MRLNKCYTVEASQCIAMLTQKFTSKSEATPIHPTVKITEFNPATTPAQLCGQNLLKCEQGEKLFKIPNLTSDDLIKKSQFLTSSLPTKSTSRDCNVNSNGYIFFKNLALSNFLYYECRSNFDLLLSLRIAGKDFYICKKST